MSIVRLIHSDIALSCYTEQQRELSRRQDRERRRMARQHESDTRRSERLAELSQRRSQESTHER